MIISSNNFLSTSQKLALNQKNNSLNHWYNTLLETAVDGIIIINSRGIIENINPSALELFQYAKSELLGKNISVLMSDPHRSNHDNYMSRYLEGGEPKIIGIGREVHGLKKDGQEFPFRLAVSKVEQNSEVFFMGIVHDQSAQKKAEQKLKVYSEQLEGMVYERTKKLEQASANLKLRIKEARMAEASLRRSQLLFVEIASNFPDGTISVFDNELRYLFVEGRELAKAGIDSSDLLGRKYIEVLEPEIYEQMRPAIEKAFAGNKSELTLQKGLSFYTLNFVPLEKEKGKVKRILVVETNVTKEKLALLDSEQNLKKEKELNELKSNFVTLASHEFRTPLSTILSSANLAKKYDDLNKEKRDKHLGRIRQNVMHMTNILEDFLSLGRLEDGKLRIEEEWLDIYAAIEEVVESMDAQLKRGQKFTISNHLKKELEIYSDSNILKYLMINLLGNAIKYSKEDKEITIEIDKQNNNLIISIIDEGIGIPEEAIGQLGERFFRAKNTGNIQGTGMGLNIVRKYLDLLEGKMEISSILGKGSNFKLILPMKFK